VTSPYSANPGFRMMEEAFPRKLKERTGLAIEQWIARVRKEGPPGEKERRAWLKQQGLTTNYAWWIADMAEERAEASPEAMVDAMYAGPKAALLPIHHALVQLGLKTGKDVKIAVCKTIVPFYRRNVFAQIKPATNTRIDFSLALGAAKAAGRLISTGGYEKKDRLTHRIPVASLADIDGELKRWLKTAYELDAPAGR